MQHEIVCRIAANLSFGLDQILGAILQLFQNCPGNVPLNLLRVFREITEKRR